jgi:hypothetical protein
MNVDDLPPKLKARALAAAQRQGITPSRAPGTRTPTDRGGSWTCHTCDTTFKAWAAAQRHADEHEHWRIETNLETTR